MRSAASRSSRIGGWWWFDLNTENTEGDEGTEEGIEKEGEDVL